MKIVLDNQPPFNQINGIGHYATKFISINQFNEVNDKNAILILAYCAATVPVNKWQECLGENGNGFKTFIFDKLSDKIKRQIKKKNIRVVIDFSMEGWPIKTQPVYNNIKNCLKKSNLPFQQFSIVIGDALIEEEITIIHHDFFEGFYHNTVTSDKTEIGKMNLARRSKKFLCLNNVPKPHRMAMVYEFYKHDLLKDGYISFPNDKNMSFYVNDSLGQDFFSTVDECLSFYYNDSFEEETCEIRSVIRSLFDLSLMKLDDISEGVSTISQHYTDSYFSIVNETATNSDSLFLSEKTWKPILMFHPFLVMGNPGTLKYLKYRGYKTFSPWIDESYDLEYDEMIRFRMIVDEVKRLCSMSYRELHEWYWEMRNITRWNYELYNIRHDEEKNKIIGRLNEQT